jgi:hypothetical protein
MRSRTNTFINLSALLYCLLIPLLAHCAGNSTSPSHSPASTTTSTLANTQQVYAQLGPALSSAASIYETTMIAAGQAHRDHLITDTQLKHITDIGGRTREAIQSAKSALVIYEQSHGATGGEVLGERFVVAVSLEAELVKVVRVAKVVK